VLRPYFTVGIHEIDVGAIVSRDHLEGSPFFWSRQAQDLSQKRRRCMAVAGPNYSVVKLNGHADLLKIDFCKMP